MSLTGFHVGFERQNNGEDSLPVGLERFAYLPQDVMRTIAAVQQVQAGHHVVLPLIPAVDL